MVAEGSSRRSRTGTARSSSTKRCTLHKDRNIQRHLPKRYRKQAHHLFATALEQNSYKDAKKMLQEFERWLRDINESAADSLVESLEEVLMLQLVNSSEVN